MHLHPEVLAAMHAAARLGGNANSQHGLGQQVRQKMDEASLWLVRWSGLPAAQVAFTPSAAEGNLEALAAAAPAAGAAATIYLPDAAATGHGPFARAWQHLAGQGLCVRPAAPGTALGPGQLLGLLAPAFVNPAADWAGLCAQVAAARAAGAWAFVDLSPVAAFAAGLPAGAAAPWGRGALTWPPGGWPHGVCLASYALGGPPGLAAWLAPRAEAAPTTLPRELVVGMGVAARRLAE